jgi:type VI secretion system secreted protein VgrG
MQHFAELDSPLGEELLFSHLTAHEGLSEPFSYSIVALSPKADIHFHALLGQHVTVRMNVGDDAGEPRCFDGIVEQISLIGQSGRFFQYLIVARPWFWFLSQTQDCKVFQNQTVLEIIDTVLADHPIAAIDNRTTTAFTPWVYCVQYRESDFNFLSRLMEQEGIYYFFEHEAGKHTLVLADAASASTAIGDPLPVRYAHSASMLNQECVWELSCTQRVQPGAAVIQDYDFTRTQVDLRQTRSQPGAHALGDLEVYDYPGFYDQGGDGEHFVRAQMEEFAAASKVASGHSDARGLCTGGLLTLKGSLRESDNCEYLVTGTQITLSQPAYESSTMAATPGYQCRFTALESRVPYRAPRKSPKPVVQGPQTAVVVGPAGDEIFTDPYGRVKVQFHWDRYGKKNETSSCWVRVSSPWAGKSFGFVQIPRIGQEVVVDFLEGDPDQPLITGRVYNAENMPPWELPGNMTQSGVLSRSSKGGAYGNANALRFEDKKGEEQLWLHAEKDQLTEVENDEDKWVGRDRRKTIDRDETNHIKQDRTETVDRNEKITVHGWRTEEVDGDETITIHSNRTERVDHNERISIGDNRSEDVGIDETISIGANRTETVGANETISIGANRSVTIGGSKAETIAMAKAESIGLAKALSIGAAYQTTVGGLMNTSVGLTQGTQVGMSKSTSVGKTYSITAGDELSITVGKASLVMKSDGTITVNGNTFSLGTTAEQTFRADGEITIKGKKILEN